MTGARGIVSGVVAACGVLVGCESPQAAERSRDAGALPATAMKSDAGGAAVSKESCLDAWLKARRLNAYGDPPDTVYAGGTPLFDERTGKQRDRAEYVFKKYPDAKAACAR